MDRRRSNLDDPTARPFDRDLDGRDVKRPCGMDQEIVDANRSVDAVDVDLHDVDVGFAETGECSTEATRVVVDFDTEAVQVHENPFEQSRSRR